MDDKSCLELADVRHLLSEVIGIYMESARDCSRGPDARLQAAQLAQGALFSYLHLLHTTDLQAEIEQFQRILGSWRSSLPKPFED